MLDSLERSRQVNFSSAHDTLLNQAGDMNADELFHLACLLATRLSTQDVESVIGELSDGISQTTEVSEAVTDGVSGSSG